MLTYTISTEYKQQHLWKVALTFSQTEKKAVTAYLANWTPGSYMIRDFAKHIISIQAKQGEQVIALKQLSKNTWQTEPIIGQISIEYLVYAFDSSVRASFLDSKRGFFDGAAILLCLPDYEHHTHHICFTPLPSGWKIAANMPSDAPLQYQASSFQECIDYPFELGIFETLEFKTQNICHKIVISGNYYDFDRQRLVQDVQKICEQEITFFGNTPFTSYLFLLNVKHNNYGGLEHRNSSALIISKENLPQENTGSDDDNYINLLGLFSHEYFHAWNVKSIKPRVFQPYDLNSEVYTEQLWAFEGITSFYDELFLLKANLISAEKYLQLISENIDFVRQQKGHTRQTIAQSSFNTWSKYYKQDENSCNAIVSYYKKGGLLAFCLDVYIRVKSKQKHSLSSVMRHLYLDYMKTQQGLSDQDWQTKITELTSIDVSEFFNTYIYDTTPLNLKEAFSHIGVKFEETKQTDYPAFGAKFIDTAKGLEIKQILNESNAELAELNPGDIVVAINHFSFENFHSIWAQTKPNTTVQIHYFRDQVLHETNWKVISTFTNKSNLTIENSEYFSYWSTSQ